VNHRIPNPALHGKLVYPMSGNLIFFEKINEDYCLSLYGFSYSESKLDAEPWQNPPDLITRFYIDGCATRQAVALRQRIFKRKKGFANISLGLIYHSKALSQPPSRNTIPLTIIVLSFPTAATLECQIGISYCIAETMHRCRLSIPLQVLFIGHGCCLYYL
jgi:hypothetical protein